MSARRNARRRNIRAGKVARPPAVDLDAAARHGLFWFRFEPAREQQRREIARRELQAADDARRDRKGLPVRTLR